jgi:hypothetical protein
MLCLFGGIPSGRCGGDVNCEQVTLLPAGAVGWVEFPKGWEGTLESLGRQNRDHDPQLRYALLGEYWRTPKVKEKMCRHS